MQQEQLNAMMEAIRKNNKIAEEAQITLTSLVNKMVDDLPSEELKQKARALMIQCQSGTFDQKKVEELRNAINNQAK